MGEPVIDRAFKLLASFGPDDRVMSLAKLSRRADVPKSSALRIARKLCDFGALERLETGEFVIGLRLLELAAMAPRGHGLRAVALPYMEDLHHATRQHVLLAVRSGNEAVLVERLSARNAGSVLYYVGGRIPLYGTGVGMCLLAYAPTAFQEEVLSGELVLRPEHRRLDQGQVRAQLATIRKEGIAIIRRPRPEPMTSVAGPVFGPHKDMIAALSVVAPTAATDAVALRPAVTAVCRAISRGLSP
ncbi:IclR family transcriptional regulator [Dactylosporangium roseum]|uniref:IclR family transcriptional regulator n=1 Tax=Dactylosporangium roseum TaxID=47989 RepID=UPI0021B208A6|nr:IclR family transcriptional regulator [Dactylosporangium roseum]